ncbi:MAG TPA: hypothetical protein VMV18_04725, partial [bacterium]|nr:hypothetical protein [bacterium]
MPFDPRSPAYAAALETFIADVEKTMHEKLTGIGEYKNLADIEAEIDRLTLRFDLLGTDPEFQEAAKRIELKRQELSRKRDQMKPFLLRCEREIAIYRAALGGGAVAPAPAPAVAAPVPAAAPPWNPPAKPAAAAAPAPARAPAAATAAPPAARAPAPPPPAAPAPMAAAPAPVAPPAPAAPAPAGEIDMSLPPEEEMPADFLASPSDFLVSMDAAGGTAEGMPGDDAELVLDTPAPPPAAAPAPV